MTPASEKTGFPDTQIDWSKGVPLTAGNYFMGLYQPSPETVGFWDGVKDDELRIKHCRDCGSLWHPKRIVCTHCGSSALDWRKTAGTGEVYSFSVVHRAPTPAFAGSVPYALGMVRLAEGVHLFTRFTGDIAALKIGAAVTVDFKVLELGQKMPVFRVGG
jgi:uncharacterized OB-fold protein